MSRLFYKELCCGDTADVAQALKRLLRQYKVVCLKNVPAGTDYADFYSRLAAQLGRPVAIGENLRTGNATAERWVHIRYDKNQASTFQHSNTRQPLHTDAAYTHCSPDINFFFCLQNAATGGATTFIDAAEVRALLAQYEPDLASRIEATEICFGKGANQRKQSKILYTAGDTLKVNWNYYRVLPQNTGAALRLRDDFHQFLENRIVAGGLLHAVMLRPGACVFFHDDEVLHGRNAFEGNRHLVKGGLNSSEAKAAVPETAGSTFSNAHA